MTTQSHPPIMTHGDTVGTHCLPAATPHPGGKSIARPPPLGLRLPFVWSAFVWTSHLYHLGGDWCGQHGKGMQPQPILKARIYFILFQKCMHYVWLYINVFIEPLKWFTMRYVLIIISAYLREPSLPPQYLIHRGMFQLAVTPVNKSYWSTSWVIKLVTRCKQLCHFI